MTQEEEGQAAVAATTEAVAKTEETNKAEEKATVENQNTSPGNGEANGKGKEAVDDQETADTVAPLQREKGSSVGEDVETREDRAESIDPHEVYQPITKDSTPEDYIIQEHHFERLLEQDRRGTARWEQIRDEPDFKFWRKTPEGSTCASFKATVVIDVKRDDVFETLWDSEYRKIWDTACLDIGPVETYKPDNDCCYFRMKFPPGISNRDACHFRGRRWAKTDEDPHILFFHSGVHPKCPKHKGDERMTSLSNGVILRVHPEDKTKTIMTSIFHDDPGGWIPKFVTNWFTSMFAPTVFREMVRAAYNYADYKAGILKKGMKLKPTPKH